MYTQFAIQDSRLFGPNPLKILAPPSNCLSKKGLWATQPLEQILDSEFLLCELGVLPVEVRCYVSCFRGLARNTRCNTLSHLTADAVFRTCLARNPRCKTMSHLTASQVRRAQDWSDGLHRWRPGHPPPAAHIPATPRPVCSKLVGSIIQPTYRRNTIVTLAAYMRF